MQDQQHEVPTINTLSGHGTSLESVLSVVIAQNDCYDCGGGLEHGQYKGEDAAICVGCGTPQAQFWQS